MKRAGPGPRLAATLAGTVLLALCAVFVSAPEALAQRVCRLDDPACNQQRMQNTREDALFQHGRTRLDGRPHLSQRYYGNRNVPAIGQPQGGRCDVEPVISGRDTRVVRTC